MCADDDVAGLDAGVVCRAVLHRPPHGRAFGTGFEIEAESDESTQAAALRLLEAGDSLGISQVESVGFRMLLRRAHDLAELQSQHGQALRSVEDLAQLLALWKPGVYSKEREEAYFDARFAARERPSYPHPAMATVLDKTYGQVLYADQLLSPVLAIAPST